MIKNLPIVHKAYHPSLVLDQAQLDKYLNEQTVEEFCHTLPALLLITGIGPIERKLVALPEGENLAAFLMKYSPDCFGGSHPFVYRNSMTKENRIGDGDVPSVIIGHCDFYICYAGPADPITAGILAAAIIGTAGGIAVGGTLGIAVGLAIGALVIGGTLIGSSLLQPPKIRTPETTSDQGAGQGTLGIPRNQSRLGSRIPDIYGRMRTWPDLIAPVYDLYNGTNYSMDIFYCIGIGHYNLQFADPRFGDTPISRFPGTTMTQIDSSQVPFGYPVLSATDEAAGLQLETRRDPTPPFPNNVDGWVTLPDDRLTQILVDLVFPSGLVQYNTGGDQVNQTVSGVIQYRRVINNVPQGIQEQEWSRRASNSGPLRYTYAVPDTGGSLAAGTYQVRVAKTFSQSSDDNIHVDDVEVGRLAGYRAATVNHNQFARDRTYVRVQVSSSRQTGPRSYEDFNLIAHRVEPILVSGGISQYAASTRWCDAMVEMLTDPFIGGYPLAEIDIPAFLDVQNKSNQMDAGEGGMFSHIFDRFMDVDEQFQAAASAMRSAVLQDYGMVSVVRDEVKTLPTALVTPGNRAEGDEGSKTLTFATPESNDGVEIEWFDAQYDYVKRIYRYPSNITLFNARKVEVVGLVNWSQVWRRAQYENNKQKYRRRTNSVTLYEDGLLMLPMDLIEVVEPWDVTRVSEVTGYFGTPTEFQSYIDIAPGIEVNPFDYMVMSNDTGNNVAVIPILAGTEGFVTRIYMQHQLQINIVGPGFAAGFPNQGTYQVGARIAIYNDARHIANRWLVSSIKPTEDKCLVTLIEYDENIYLGDTYGLPINPKPR